MPGGGLWEWFAGGSAGYLFDSDEAMYGLQVGMETRNPSNRANQAIYLELGFTQTETSYEFFPPIPGSRWEEGEFDLNIMPITLNYRYGMDLTERLGCFFGLGAGVAIVDSSYDWSWTQVTSPPVLLRGSGSEDETDARFYGNVFAGLTYEMTESLRLFGGVRYIVMDEKEFESNATGAGSYDGGINGDVLIELGLLFRF